MDVTERVHATRWLARRVRHMNATEDKTDALHARTHASSQTDLVHFLDGKARDVQATQPRRATPDRVECQLPKMTAPVERHAAAE